VAGVFEQEAVAEPGDGAIELGGKARLGEDQLQLRHGDQGLANGAGVGAQAVGHFEQNAVNLARLFLGQPHQLVVEVDGFERLDEQGVPLALAA